MAKGNAIVSVGLQLNTGDLDKIYNQLVGMFSNLGNNVHISDDLRKQIQQMIQDTEELRESFAKLGSGKVNTATFEKARDSLVSQVNQLERRTSVLETTVRGLISTLSTDAGSEMNSSLKELMETMDKATTTALGMANAVSGVVASVGKNGKISIVDEKSLRKQADSLAILGERVRSLTEGSRESEKDYKTIKTVKKHLESALKDYNDTFNKWSVQTPDVPGFNKLQKHLVASARELYDVVGNASAFSGSDLIDPLAAQAEEALEKLEDVKKSIDKQILDIGRTLGDIPASATHGEDGKMNGYEIPIGFSTTAKGLTTKLQAILHQVQAAADKEEIQIKFNLMSPTQTKKANAALKKFQEQISNISDKSTREEMQSLAAELQKDFGAHISGKLQTAFDDAADAVRKVLSELRREINSNENKLVINPSIKFDEDEIQKLKEQVQELSQSLLNEIQEATKNGLFPKDGDGKNDAFKDIEERVRKLLEELKSIPESFNKISLDKLFTFTDTNLEGLIKDLKGLDGLSMGNESAGKLADNLIRARDAVKDLMAFGNGDITLEGLGKKWKASDDDMIARYGKNHLRERSAIYTRSGKIYGDYAYGMEHSTGNKQYTLKRVKAENEIPYFAIHTHPNTHIPSMSYGDGSVDLSSFARQLRDGVTKQATIAAASNMVQVFDAERFYNDYSNIDFASPNIKKKIQNSLDRMIENIGIFKKTGPFLAELLDEWGGGFNNALEQIFRSEFSTFDSSKGSYFDQKRPVFEKAIKQIRENFDNITVGNFTGDPLSSPLYTLFKELNIAGFSSNDDWVKRVVEDLKQDFSINGLFTAAGIPELGNNEDIFQFQLGKMMPYILEMALGKKNFKAKDFIDKGYAETLSLEDFSKKYGITSDILSGVFENTGIEQFASQLQSIVPALQSLSNILTTLPELSSDGKLNLGFDDASGVVENIKKIANALSELVNIYKQINNVGEFGFDASKLAESLKKWDMLPTSYKRKSSKLAELFGEDNKSNDFRKMLLENRPQGKQLSDESYTTWATNVIEYCEKAGIALDEFKVKQKETASEAQNINFNIDDASSVAQNINKIKDALLELIDVYKKLNSTGAEFNVLKLANSLSAWNKLPTSHQRKPGKLSELFGEGNNTNDFRNFIISNKPVVEDQKKLSDGDYIQWANNIIAASERAGIALDEFRVKQQESQSFKFDIDNDQFDKLVKNTTTLKNSLNTLRKELGDLKVSTDLSSITAPLESLQNTLLEFSEVVQKATGILSKSNLEKEFNKIKESAEKLNGVKLNTKAGKEGATSIISAYKDYLSKGGESTLEDIGGSKNLQKYLAKHINDSATEGAAGAEKEAGALKETGEAAQTAAESKERFAKANQELLSSIIASIGGIDNEGKAFKNLTQMFNTLGGEHSTEKMLKIREALHGIIECLNTDVGEASFMKSLENLAATGDTLKDLATVIKATKKQINQASGATGILSGSPERDYSQEKLNAGHEDLNEIGRQFFSQYGMILENVIRENRDGQLEFVALVKDSMNRLKEYTAIYTGSEKQPFNIKNIDTNAPRNVRKALQYEKIYRAWQKMNENKIPDNVTNEIMFDRDNPNDAPIWDTLMAVYEQYRDYIGNLQKVTRQVRQNANGDLLESFSFIGDQGHITMGREGEIVASSQNIDDVLGVADAFEQLYAAAKKYYDLRLKQMNGSASVYELQQLQDAEDTYNNLLKKANELKERFGDNIASDALKQYQNDIGKNFDEQLGKQIASYQSKIEKITQTRTNQRNAYLPGFQQEIDEAANSIKRLNELRIQHGDGKEWDPNELIEVNKLLKQINDTYTGLNDKRNIAAKTEDVDNLIGKLEKLRNENSLDSDLDSRVASVVSYLKEVRSNGDDAGEALAKISQTDFGRLNGQLKTFTAEMQSGGMAGKNFLKQFSSAITSQSAQFLATYFSLQDFIRYGREITQTVTQLDSGMTELRKVSGETDLRLAQSFKTSAESAKQYGSTISDIIQSTADWSRLGYEIDDAEQLARSTALFQNVGDEMSQDTASEYLVSTMQGFQLEAGKSLDVIDKYNEVANNYAINTAGIGEALERSAAAFNASGTSLDKSIALVTAMTEVTQDPASAGTAWKTISARIRGAKTEWTNALPCGDMWVIKSA